MHSFQALEQHFQTDGDAVAWQLSIWPEPSRHARLLPAARCPVTRGKIKAQIMPGRVRVCQHALKPSALPSLIIALPSAYSNFLSQACDGLHHHP